MIPVIIGKFVMQAIHIVIAICFCKNGCSSDRKIFPIPLDDSRMRYVKVLFKPVAINEQMLRAKFQLIDCPVHGKKRSIKNIYLINFFGRNNSYRPSNSLFLYHLTQCITLLFGELLRIIQQFIPKVLWKNNSSSIDSTGAAATTPAMDMARGPMALKPSSNFSP